MWTNYPSHSDPFISLNLTIWFLKWFLKFHSRNWILMQIKRNFSTKGIIHGFHHYFSQPFLGREFALCWLWQKLPLRRISGSSICVHYTFPSFCCMTHAAGMALLRIIWNFIGFLGKQDLPKLALLRPLPPCPHPPTPPSTPLLFLPHFATSHLPFSCLVSSDTSPSTVLPPPSLCPSCQPFPFPLQPSTPYSCLN